MDDTTQADINPAPAAEPATTVANPSEDVLAQELESVKRPKRSKLDTLVYNRDRLTKEIEEERKAAGLPEIEEDRPLTIRDLERFNLQTAKESALNLAESIPDEKERELTKFHLENTIKPSGDPATDYANAKLLVNGVKNGQKAEELARFRAPRTVGTAPGAPIAETPKKPELSKEDQAFARGIGLTEEEALAAVT